MSQIDARQVDQQFHTNPVLLQTNEVCELAFQGRRDLVLFTTKRILFIDKQGWSGKKVSPRRLSAFGLIDKRRPQNFGGLHNPPFLYVLSNSLSVLGVQ